MTIREFDVRVHGVVDYAIYDGSSEMVDCFTRDIGQAFKDEDKYNRNTEKFVKYSDAVIYSIYTLNDIIRVCADITNK